MEKNKRMQFYGSTLGACAPLLVFMCLMIVIAAMKNVRIASVAKNASGIEILRLAESSSVLSSHCVEEISAGFFASFMTYLAKETILSQRMGFLLYAIAEDPI